MVTITDTVEVAMNRLIKGCELRLLGSSARVLVLGIGEEVVSKWERLDEEKCSTFVEI